MRFAARSMCPTRIASLALFPRNTHAKVGHAHTFATQLYDRRTRKVTRARDLAAALPLDLLSVFDDVWDVEGEKGGGQKASPLLCGD